MIKMQSAIKKMHHTEDESASSPYMTYASLSTYTSIPLRTLARLVHERRIPHHRPGGKRLVRFCRSEIDAWMIGADIEAEVQSVTNSLDLP